MAVTHTYTTTIKGALGTLAPSPKVVTGDAGEMVSSTVDASGTLVETLAIPMVDIAGFYLWSDKAVTVTTNTPTDDTFVLVAGVPYYWFDGLGASPITADIAELHFDNTANLAVANVKAEFVLTAGA